MLSVFEKLKFYCFYSSDADKDDTGRYKVEIGNASGVGVCDVPIKVKGK